MSFDKKKLYFVYCCMVIIFMFLCLFGYSIIRTGFIIWLAVLVLYALSSSGVMINTNISLRQQQDTAKELTPKSFGSIKQSVLLGVPILLALFVIFFFSK